LAIFSQTLLFFMENYTRAQLSEDVEVKPGITVPRVLALNWDLIEKTKLPFITVDLTPDENLPLTHSKLGHHPVLPKGFEFPKDEKGNPLFLLAQINFSEMPKLEGYPEAGFLQFYIANDDVFGLDFDNGANQKNFRVLFFEPAEVADPQTDFSFLKYDDEEAMLPFTGSYAMTFTPGDDYVGINDVRFSLGDLTTKYEPVLKDVDVEEALMENFKQSGHRIGGYSFFTQTDPRMYGEQYKDYIMLLQVDSEDDIMWGDMGVANFFIHPDDLAKKDFSKVLYNWDCY
jgi:uncharacterized protein YwqG